MSLPPGWEERYDPVSKRNYYVDHVRRLTVWERPSLPTYPGSSGPSPAPSSYVAPSLSRQNSGSPAPPAPQYHVPQYQVPEVANRSTYSVGQFAPPIPSRASKPEIIRRNRPLGSSDSLQEMPLFPEEPRSLGRSHETPSPDQNVLRIQSCQSLAMEMNGIAQSVDVGVMTAKEGFQNLEICKQKLQALQTDSPDPELASELSKTIAMAKFVAEKLKTKVQVEKYCESLQRLHIRICNLLEKARSAEKSEKKYAEMKEELGRITLKYSELKNSDQPNLDDATISYDAKVERMFGEVTEVIAGLKPPSVPLRKQGSQPISPRTGGRAGLKSSSTNVIDSGVSQDEHTFSLVSSVAPIHCGLCKKLRTNLRSFSCNVCGCVVHKHCLPLVSSSCIANSTHSSDLSDLGGPEGFEAMNLSSVIYEGTLWKKSRNGNWNERYFIIPADDEHFTMIYFDKQPTDEAFIVPKGCIHLYSSNTSILDMEDGRFAFAINSDFLDRSVVLATQTTEDRDLWMNILAEGYKKYDTAFKKNNKFEIIDAEWEKVPKISKPKGVCTLESQLTGERKFENIECFDGDHCNLPFEIIVDRVSSGVLKPNASLFVTVRGYYAGKKIIPDVQTKRSATGSWGAKLELSPLWSRFPCETVLMFSLYEIAPSAQTGKMKKLFFGKDVVTNCLGHAHLALIDECGFVKTGFVDLNLWPEEGSAVHFQFNNPKAEYSLRIEMPKTPLPVSFGSFPSELLFGVNGLSSTQPLTEILAPIKDGVPNPLTNVSRENLLDAWQNRYNADAEILDWVFLGCNFLDPAHRIEANQLCKSCDWNLPLFVSLHLVGFSFSCIQVRARAMYSLCSILSNEDLKRLANVIMYAVRFELHDWSPLIEILLKRVIVSNELVFAFFWSSFAQGEGDTPLAGRFRKFSAVLLKLVPKGMVLQVRDAKYVEQIISITRDGTRRKGLPKLLAARRWDDFVLPTSTKHKVIGLDEQNSKTLGSSAGPVLFRFFSPLELSVPDFIVKAGDDIRQDELVLLIGNLMNSIWQDKGVNAELLLYQCTSIGHEVGFIEVVPRCVSLGKVQGNSVSGAFKRSAIKDWLLKQNANGTWQDTLENYMKTLAGACVFEYVMGFGDRHCDNILFNDEGKVFHIDFGMILGKDYGVAATIPFTLTQQMLEVIGGKEGRMFDGFVKTATAAFIAVRRHHVLLTSITMLCVAGKLPSCQKIEDVKHLRDALCVNLTEKDAADHFKSLIYRVSDSLAPQLNDAMHSWYMNNIAAKAYK